MAGPGLERAARGGPEAGVGLPFREDVAQRRRPVDARRHGKREAVRLAFAVVRILAEDYGPDRVKRRQTQALKTRPPGG